MKLFFVIAAAAAIIVMSFMVGYFIEKMNLRRRFELVALVAAIWVAVGVSHLLPLGEWSTLGYGVAVIATTIFVYTGWRMSRVQAIETWRARRRQKEIEMWRARHRQGVTTKETDPLAEPENWGGC